MNDTIELSKREKATVGAMEALMKPKGTFQKGGIRLVALHVPKGTSLERIEMGMKQLLGNNCMTVRGAACAFVNKRGSKNRKKSFILEAEQIARKQQETLHAMKQNNTLGPTVLIITTDPGELAQPWDEKKTLPWSWEFRQDVYRTFHWPTQQITAPPQPTPATAPQPAEHKRKRPIQQPPAQPRQELRAAS